MSAEVEGTACARADRMPDMMVAGDRKSASEHDRRESGALRLCKQTPLLSLALDSLPHLGPSAKLALDVVDDVGRASHN